jgi:spore coat protein CotH
MNISRPSRLAAGGAALALAVGSLAGCAAAASTDPQDVGAADADADAVETDDAQLWDQTVVHSIALDYDQADYDAMIAAYLDSGEKEWISATVVIDGATFEDVGLKLKGNSSLRGLSSDADAELSSAHPATLPWIIDLDKFVDGQNLNGTVELVIRGNSSETSLNEAVALDLLEASGLASEQAIAAGVQIGGESELRLVIENPDDAWLADEFESATALYKAESGGDYSYRGDDPESYADVFDQEAGDDDLAPLIDFLRFLDESDDATFEAELSSWLDVDAFATYLAFQDLIDNVDDIDGPGNNSYLAYDAGTGVMTVVSWDLNLAFGASPGGGGGRADAAGGGPDRAEEPNGAGAAPGAMGGPAAGGGGRGGGGNILAERFLASDAFSALYDAESERLSELLYTSGLAQESLDAWVHTLTTQAGDLVSASVIESEADALSSAFGS